MNLHEIQQHFLNHLLERPNKLHTEIKEDVLPIKKRLQIYRESAQLIIIDVLKKTYPVTMRIISEKFFIYAAHEYLLKTPPQTGDMNDYGASFPDFLSKFTPLKPHPYIPDLARLEWLREQAFHSADAQTLTAKDVKNLSQKKLQRLSFTLHPSVYLHQSQWPVAHIWENFHEKGSGEIVNDMNQPEYMALHRPTDYVRVTKLSKKGFALLQSIQKTTTFAKLFEKNSKDGVAFSALIGELIGAELFIKNKNYA